jgi:hypothetical protein
MKILLIAGHLLFGASLAQAYGHDAPPPSDDGYEKIEVLLEANCVSCHNEVIKAGTHSFELKEEVLSHCGMIIESMNHGRMPLDNPDWSKSEEATLVITWLQERCDDSGHDH